MKSIKMEFIKEELNKIKESLKDSVKESVVTSANYDLVVRELQQNSCRPSVTPEQTEEVSWTYTGNVIEASFYFDGENYSGIEDLQIKGAEYPRNLNQLRMIKEDVEVLNNTLQFVDKTLR